MWINQQFRRASKDNVALAKTLLRTHLKNFFGRDIGQSFEAQGARAKACLTHSEPEATRRRERLAISHAGSCDFFVPLRCGFVGVPQGTPSLPRLADTIKSLRTRLERVFEMGSISVPPLFPRV